MSDPDYIKSILGTWIIALGFWCLFLPLLYYYYTKAKDDLPIFFHRQRREVLFLRKRFRVKELERLVIPWEEVLARVDGFYSGSQFGVRRRSNLLIGAEDPQNPGFWWSIHKFIALNNSFARLNWGAICRFMDAHPDHFFPGDNGLEDFYEESSPFWHELPDFVREWVKPIPKEEWKEPSIKLRWYNAYLIRLYAYDVEWIYIGNIEDVIGYPGDEEAERQLADNWLVPVPTPVGSEHPPVRPAKQPDLPTGPFVDMTGEPLAPRKKRKKPIVVPW